MVGVEAARGARRGERVGLVHESVARPGDIRGLPGEALRGAGPVALVLHDRHEVA